MPRDRPLRRDRLHGRLDGRARSWPAASAPSWPRAHASELERAAPTSSAAGWRSRVADVGAARRAVRALVERGDVLRLHRRARSRAGASRRVAGRDRAGRRTTSTRPASRPFIRDGLRAPRPGRRGRPARRCVTAFGYDWVPGQPGRRRWRCDEAGDAGGRAVDVGYFITGPAGAAHERRHAASAARRAGSTALRLRAAADCVTERGANAACARFERATGSERHGDLGRRAPSTSPCRASPRGCARSNTYLGLVRPAVAPDAGRLARARRRINARAAARAPRPGRPRRSSRPRWRGSERRAREPRRAGRGSTRLRGRAGPTAFDADGAAGWPGRTSTGADGSTLDRGAVTAALDDRAARGRLAGAGTVASSTVAAEASALDVPRRGRRRSRRPARPAPALRRPSREPARPRAVG